MSWSKIQIKQHREAARLICKIKDEALRILRTGITEFEIQKFITERFLSYGLKSDKLRPIVAFRENTAFVHYHPEVNSKKLFPDSLILLDIWARLKDNKAPFADMTWMAYYGKKAPRNFLEVFTSVIRARDMTLKFIRRQAGKDRLPTGKEIDSVAREFLEKSSYGKNFLHGTGHPLGFTSCHGRGILLNRRGKGKVRQNIAYTIEPGAYFQNKFGVRSEIDFYLNENNKLLITTQVQDKLTYIYEN